METLTIIMADQLEMIKDVPVVAELIEVGTMVWKGFRITFVDPIMAQTKWGEAARRDIPSTQRVLYLLTIALAHLFIAIGVAVQIGMDTTKDAEGASLYTVTNSTGPYHVSKSQIWELGVCSTLFVLAGLANLGFRFTHLGHELSDGATNLVEVGAKLKATFLTTVVRYVQLLSLLDVFLVCSSIGWIIDTAAATTDGAERGDHKLLIIFIPTIVLAATDLLFDMSNVFTNTVAKLIPQIKGRVSKGATVSSGLVLTLMIIRIKETCTGEDTCYFPTVGTGLSEETLALTLVYCAMVYIESGFIERMHKWVQADAGDNTLRVWFSGLVNFAFPYLIFAYNGVVDGLNFGASLKEHLLPLSYVMVGSLILSLLFETAFKLEAACFNKLPVKLTTTGFAFSLYAVAAVVVKGLSEGDDKIGFLQFYNGADADTKYIPAQLLFLLSAIFSAADVGADEDSGLKGSMDLVSLNVEKKPLVKQNGLRRARRMVEGRMLV